MFRIVVETAFAQTTIYPSAYSVDVVSTPHDDMLVIAYSDNDEPNVATYPLHYVYRYTVSGIDLNEDKEENSETSPEDISEESTS